MESSMDWVFPKDFIVNPRGENGDGSSTTQDRDHRSRTIWFMEDMSKALNMDRRVLYTASVYFHRFYLFHSFGTQNRFHVAVACLFLAGKVEEKAFKLKDLVQGYFAVRLPKTRPTEEMLKEMNKNVILAERLVLQALNFDLHITHPYGILLQRMKDLRSYIAEDVRKNLLQTAVNFLNDSYRSTFCLEYTPVEIGVAVLYLAALTLSVTPVNPNPRHNPTAPTWLSLLDRDIRETRLRSLCLEILEMYDTLTMASPDLTSKRLERQQTALRVRDDIPIAEESRPMLSSSSLLSLATTTEVHLDIMEIAETASTPAAAYAYGEESYTYEGSHTPREAEQVEEPARRLPSITVTHFTSSAVKLQREVSASSSHFDGEGSLSLTAPSEDMEGTPVYSVSGGFSTLRAESEDAASDTPRFSDLAAKVRPGRQRSRSNSLTDHTETKRHRVE